MIIDIKELDFVIDEEEALDFVIDEDESLDFELDEYVNIAPIIDPYPGPYVVIPKTVDQVLETNNKRMTDDVTVTEIPYAEVGNQYGITVTIAS